MMSHGHKAVCGECGGARYKIGTQDEFAVARLCRCATPCPICNDRRYVLVDENKSKVAKECDCARLHKRVTLFNQARIPGRFADRWIDDIQPTHDAQNQAKYALLQYCDAYEKGQRGFLLWGNPGVGKTHMMCGLISYLTLERGISCRFIDFMQLISDLKAGYAQGKWDSDVVQPLLKVDVLVVDELGKGKDSEWELGILDQLISSRYNANKTMHATSNLRPSVASQEQVSYTDAGPIVNISLQNRLGERIYSRLFEMCRILQVQGDDHRTGAAGRSAVPFKTREAGSTAKPKRTP